MKTNRSIFIVLITWLSLCCERNPFDYRTKMIGEYDCQYHYTSWTGSSIPCEYDSTQGCYGISVDTTIQYTSKIDYGPKAGQISVTQPSGRLWVFDVDRDGSVFLECEIKVGVAIGGGIFFQYEDDRYCTQGPRGSDWLRILTGKKIE